MFEMMFCELILQKDLFQTLKVEMQGSQFIYT